MSDDQFNQLIGAVTRTNEDHDILIQIKTTAELNLKFQTESFERHMKEDAEAFAEIKTSVKAMHRRLDGIISLKDRLLGAAALVSFLLVVYQTWKG